jgi:hypothetical protein
MLYWETKFRNERRSAVDVLEGGGRTLLTLEPGQTKFVESKDAATSYAAFDEVVFKENGEVKLHENRAWRWPNPNGLLMLTIINRDGAQCECFRIGGDPVHAFKGIPKFVGVDIHDTAWAQVERLEVMNVEKKIREGDYIVKRTTLEHVKTMRSKKEIRAIQERLLAEAAANAQQELRRMFQRMEQPEK